MGVVGTMVQSESLRTITSFSDTHSEERLEILLMESGNSSFKTEISKYKKRKISAVRDFPPGCGRFAQIISLSTVEEIAAENSSSKDDSINELKQTISDFLKDADEVVVASPKDATTSIPSDSTILSPLDRHNFVPDSSGLEKCTARKYPPRRAVSAVRDFPPFCGRNAPPPPKEESQKILFSADINSFGTENPEGPKGDNKSHLEIMETVGKQIVDDFQDDAFQKKESGDNGAFQRKELAGNVYKVVKDEDYPECEKESQEGLPLKNDVSIQEKSGAGMEKSLIEAMKTDVKQKIVGDGDPENEFMGKQRALISKKVQSHCKGNDMKYARDDCVRPLFEDKLVWWDHEFETVVGKDDGNVGPSEEKTGKEIVIYSEDKRVNEELLDASGVSSQLQLEKFGSPGLISDRVVVQGLMAAPNCPWRQVKEPLKSKKSVDKSKGKQIGSESRLERSKTVIRKKAHKKEIGVKSLKNTPPAKVKIEDQGKSQFVTHDRKDPVECIEQHGDLSLVPAISSLDPYVLSIGDGSSSSKSHDKEASIFRVKVRETLRLFQAICRKLLQEEEAKSSKGGKVNKRIDNEAAKLLKEKDKYLNVGKQILGSVPGVEVGDEFHYRVELIIIGLHRHTQGGIDYVKQGGKILATSIVASGGYANEFDNSDVLIYTGQGGNIMTPGKEPEDQKLERGNLALKNSMYEKNPVRVIRGSESSDGKSRTYVYDGLYLVSKCWQDLGTHGKLVFKFQLERIPGQPELAWKEVRKSKKSKVRVGLCVDDISQGKESIRICAVNTIDDEKPPPFKYITRVMYPDWLVPTPGKGCNCVAKCSDSEKCSCAVKNGGEIPFNHNGAIVKAKPLVYECGPSCKCPPSCHNRASQHGIKFQLEIFKTESRGWGVRSLNSIPSGSFICEYTGKLLEEKEADARTSNDEYLFDIGNNYNDHTLWDGLSTIMPEVHSSSCEVVENGSFTIDAVEDGNIGRFINHSCSPNLYAQNVLYDHDDKRIPHIMFFAVENIPPLQELTYHYNYVLDQVRDANGNIKKKSCFCGSAECSGRMY